MQFFRALAAVDEVNQLEGGLKGAGDKLCRCVEFRRSVS